jgi:transcription elongation factor Elf1
MGDRYTGNFKCEYCNTLNEDVWYAPTCGAYTFKCAKCGRSSFIDCALNTKSLEHISFMDVYEAFLGASNVDWGERNLTRMIMESFENIMQIMKNEQEEDEKLK